MLSVVSQANLAKSTPDGLDGSAPSAASPVVDAVGVDELLNASLAHSGLEPITWKPASEPGTPALNRRISNRLLKQRGFELSHPRIALLNGDGEPQREPTSTAEPTSPQR